MIKRFKKTLKEKLISKAVSVLTIDSFIKLKEEYSFKKLKKGEKIFICAMPKSGGTFLAKFLSEYFNYPYAHISDRTGACEFDIYHPKLISTYQNNLIVHQHTLGTKGNIYYLKKYGIKPVVLTRNIFDVIVSLRDHMVNESMEWQFYSIKSDFLMKNKKSQYDFIIDIILPWLIHFYVSWYRVSKNKELQTLNLTFENMVTDTNEFMQSIINSYTPDKLDTDKIDKIINSLSKENIRFNKGIIGRGKIELGEHQKSKITKLLSQYHDIDFSGIGVDI